MALSTTWKCSRYPCEFYLILGSLLSDSGKSIAFDERGSGFGRGEGCGILVLKPLDRAIADKDAIRAVIRGTGINQDGKTAGITMPNGDAQGKCSPSDLDNTSWLIVWEF